MPVDNSFNFVESSLKTDVSSSSSRSISNANNNFLSVTAYSFFNSNKLPK